MQPPKREAKPASIPELEQLIAAAVGHQEARQFDKAEEVYRKIVAIVPNWAEAQTNLASALHHQGKLQEAAERYERALQLKPGFAEIHYNLGNLLKEQNRLEAAASSYEKALALKPGYVEAHNNLGVTLQQQKLFNQAVEHFERALSLKPDYAEAHNNLGAVLVEKREFARAMMHHERALALKPDFAEAHNNLGIVLQRQGKVERAVAHYERALAITPDYAKSLNNFGTALKELGRLKEATAQFDQAIALRPDFAEAHYNRAELTAFHPGDARLVELEALAAGMGGSSENTKIHIHFALAKALDDIGDYTRAFDQMLAGNALKRREIDYDEARSLRMFQLIRDAFEPGIFERFRGAGCPARTPIFVLGMPRSGSTLIEQILASHPDVHGAGELDNLSLVANSDAPFPACIPNLDAVALLRLGQAYVASLPEIPPGKSRITDKSPLNFMHVGLIRLILPNARIVHTMRDPVDNCISCFSKLFTADMQFTYDLAELGRYHRACTELMAHWRSVLPPGSMLDVSYENVVDNLEEQARRLLDFCGLPWDARCLSFYKTGRPITTASAVQVRQPLFRSSLHRREHYKDSLLPLLIELGRGT